MYRQASLEKYKNTPDVRFFRLYTHKYDVPGMEEAAAKLGEDVANFSLFDEQTYSADEPQWGMAIDLNSLLSVVVYVSLLAKVRIISL